MVVTNTFLSKCNTIVDGSVANTGLNPILQLYYGNMHTRGLIYFDETKVKNLVGDKTYPDLSKLKHVLKMWNASDINVPGITKRFPDSYLTGLRERATSFDLLLLRVPKFWDAGRGFDFSQTKTLEGYRAYSEYGSNWYNATTDTHWDSPGVFDNGTILEDIDFDEYGKIQILPNAKYVITSQHFDFGNEPIEMDITDIFNEFILETKENNGFLLTFVPTLEEKKNCISQYSGFFTCNTNTFFEPYVQTTYTEPIKDDRASFYIGKTNKLYFYSNIGGNCVNLDTLPSCFIDGSPCEVTQESKGIYSVEYFLSSLSEQAPTSHTDIWSDISYKNVSYPDVKLRFTSLPTNDYFQFGLPFDTERKPRFDVTLSGVDWDAKVLQGEIRKLVAHVRAQYTSDQECPDATVDYRVYTVFDNKELDVIPWHQVDKEYTTYVIPLDTDSFVPQVYHIDLRVKHGNEMLIKQGAAEFEIVSKADKMQS